jgi:hypothetical protein
LATVASESGYGISEWDIREIDGDFDPYRGSYPDYDGPAAADVRAVIKQQQKLLAAAGDMAGDPL